ncbi:DUF2145 domain-containing protein [Niveibacterium terrae]|uniref:DUF2145 domain-containing protein n=1 Tax=Niveibacterium terrae TaxID=3373598 RepID=UPI003A916517
MKAGARRRLFALASIASAALLASGAASADSLSYCGHPAQIGTVQADRLLQMGSLVEKLIEGSGAQAAIISRSGLDLRRFDIRYSHAGIAQKGENGWQVRQLYFDCKEERPRIFDQGVPGFVLSQDDMKSIYVSLLFLPKTEEALLGMGAEDKRLSLSLLASEYSANAYPFSTRYQNCNQWVIEMIAQAWGGLAMQTEVPAQRREAQTWLAANGYPGSEIRINPLFMFASRFVPFLHREDHPEAELADNLYRVSLPAAIERFVKARAPATTRTELCLSGKTVVIREGWKGFGEGCFAEEGDRSVALD